MVGNAWDKPLIFGYLYLIVILEQMQGIPHPLFCSLLLFLNVFTFQHRDDEEAGEKCVDEEFGREQPRTDRHTSFSCVPSRLVAYFQYLVDYPPLRYLFLLFFPLFLLLLVRPILISDNISGLHSGRGGEDERSKVNMNQTEPMRSQREPKKSTWRR